MDFIKAYFNIKFGATRRLFDLIGYAWNDKMWLDVVTTTLQALYCVVLGALILPHDIGFAVVAWHRIPGYREMIEFIGEAITLN